MKYDVVVIGSGASGMCAALALARHGQRVALVERHGQLAPLLRRFNRNGWWCDPGLHYAGALRPGGALAATLRYLGLSDLVEIEPLDPDGFDIIQRVGREPVRLPVGIERVKETLIGHFPRSLRAVEAYIAGIESVYRDSVFLNPDLPAAQAVNQELDDSQSLWEFLSTHGAEPDLQEMLGRYGGFLCGVEGRECPFTLHALILGSFYQSAHTFARGGDEIVEAFERRLAEADVDVRCGKAVVGLKVDDRRRLTGVMLEDDELLECQAGVCTIHPQLLPDLLPPGSLRPAFLSRVREQENTFGPLAVFLEVEDPPAVLRRSNVYFLDEESPETPGRWGLAAMSCGVGVGSDGRKSLSLVRKCPSSLPPLEACGKRNHRENVYKDFKQEEIERTVEEFLQHFPGSRGRCRILESSTPWTYESYTGTVGGSTYGLKHSTARRGLGVLTPIRGLYLAGQSVLAPGLMGVLISGLVAVSTILGLGTVLSGLRKCR